MSQMSTKLIKTQRIGIIFLLLICLLMPLGASAQQYTLTKISGDGQTGTPGQTLEPLIVEVRDQNGNLASGVFVSFLQDSGLLSTILDVTGADGRVETTLTLGSSTGTTTVTVRVGGASVTFEAKAALPPAKLMEVSGNNQTGHTGASLGRPFVVEVRDENDAPLEGVTVTFAVTGDGSTLNPETMETNSRGRAWTRLTLGDNPGTNTVTASVAGVSETVVFNAEATLAPPLPMLSIISGDGQIGTPGQTLEPFVVEVRDQNGNLASGVFVSFVQDSGLLSTILDVTGADGRAETTLTLGSDTGTTTVTAQVRSVSITFEATVILPPAAVMEVSGNNQTGHTGASLAQPFVVEVRDEENNPVGGVTVTFAVSEGGGTLNPETVETNSRGRAWTRLTLGDNPGTNTVTASVAGVSETVVFNAEATLAPPPPMLSIISGDGQIGTPGQTLEPFVVEVRDQNGNLLSGAFVSFLQDSGLLSTIFDVTGADGRAETTLTLGSSTGTTTVTVRVGGASVTFEAKVALPPAKLMEVSGNNQTGYTGTSLARPFVVEVRDENDAPLERVTVTFTVTGGGGTLNPETMETNSRGRAWTRLTLGDNPGTNTVTASVAGVSETVVFNAEATVPPPPPMLSIISGDGQVGTPGQMLEPFVVEVRDQSGNLLSGVFVSFFQDSGLLSTIFDVTGADGRAETTLTLGSSTGTTTVTAQVRGASVTFETTVILPPATVTAVSGNNQTGYVGTSLARPFVVEVRDEENNPVGGVTVTFAVSEGGGSINPETMQTNPNGRARSLLTLGNNPGTNTVTVSVVGVAETETFTAIGELPEFDLSLKKGLNLIHVPLKVSGIDGMPGTIESVSDLYDALGGADALNWLITYDPQAQTWYAYFGDADRGSIADRVLTDQTGVLADVKIPVSVRLGGEPLGENGMATITLHRRLNMVGLPLRDPRVTRVSDLLGLEGSADNVHIIVVTENGIFKAVGRAGDSGDIPITGGQAFLLFASDAATIPITGTAWNNVP